MRVLPAGPSALVIECRDGEQVEAWRAEFWRRREAGELIVTDIVPGARTVLLDGVAPGTAALLGEWPEPAASQGAEKPLIEISTTFDGEDLPDVAELWGVSVSEAVSRLVATELLVAFCGFAPGFAYLRGLPEGWSVPRLAAPRPRVPAGAVGLAGPYAGIYPTASPGGWRLVGRTGQALFDVRAEPPALLTPGTRVRLVPA
ncbi:5-oxoprolinase subunit B family protein [Paractinoplanes toevensis]|uniref:Allophanate hydrolase n=1 Tax=Paractinoplanes toevensis TaxID=571911 RepID=A0A919WBN1_9ACTN|nr:allophanate hydrolase subunit 1 [Actinoplanes toevensis]GIM97226.1 allophanate hydrolase [Actinoplanes toevensis]